MVAVPEQPPYYFSDCSNTTTKEFVATVYICINKDINYYPDYKKGLPPFPIYLLND